MNEYFYRVLSIFALPTMTAMGLGKLGGAQYTFSQWHIVDWIWYSLFVLFLVNWAATEIRARRSEKSFKKFLLGTSQHATYQTSKVAPADPVKGSMWYNTETNTPFVWDDRWVPITQVKEDTNET